jgi:hypothetical protein
MRAVMLFYTAFNWYDVGKAIYFIDGGGSPFPHVTE